MSDKTQPTPPPTPVQKTAAVPLKKETVRITLRARPGAGLTQPKEMTAPVPPASITSPVPRPITTSVTPAGASTSRVPTAPAPMSPVPLAKTGSISIASKATAPIQLPSAPLPPPAARPATAPVQLPPGAPPSARTTAYVKLDTVPVPAAPAAPSRPPAPSAPPRPLAPSGGGAPPRPPGAPAAPRPGGGAAAMAPTVPLAKAPAPPRPGGAGASMAPTVPLSKAPGAPKPPTASGAKIEAGASTVPLSKTPGAPKPPGGGTAPMAKTTGGPTQMLPKATVQLAKGTQAMAGGKAAAAIATPPSAPVKRAATQDSSLLYEEKDPEAGLAPLAVVCTVLALALMALNLLGSDRAFYANPGEDSAFMVPPPEIPAWEEADGSGGYTSRFNKELEKITKKFE